MVNIPEDELINVRKAINIQMGIVDYLAAKGIASQQGLTVSTWALRLVEAEVLKQTGSVRKYRKRASGNV
jgi:hypothetical protein